MGTKMVDYKCKPTLTTELAEEYFYLADDVLWRKAGRSAAKRVGVNGSKGSTSVKMNGYNYGYNAICKALNGGFEPLTIGLSLSDSKRAKIIRAMYSDDVKLKARALKIIMEI